MQGFLCNMQGFSRGLDAVVTLEGLYDSRIEGLFLNNVWWFATRSLSCTLKPKLILTQFPEFVEDVRTHFGNGGVT